MDFFELEIVSEFADGRLVPAIFIVKILAVNTRKVLIYVSKENNNNLIHSCTYNI